jgi:hypothetical protein
MLNKENKHRKFYMVRSMIYCVSTVGAQIAIFYPYSLGFIWFAEWVFH